MIDRRRLGALSLSAAAATAAPAWGQGAQPVIVAEGGSAEERIEDTRPAFDAAIDEGCDFIQANLTPSKDGALVARRSQTLSASTDVATRPEFADRKITKSVDGRDSTDWFCEDFTLAELQSLKCREAEPALRPQNVRYDGTEPVLSLADVLAIARAGCVRTARIVGVCVRPLRPARFEGLGLDVVQRLADELSIEGYVAPAAAIWMQASEPEALRTFGKISPVRRMLMLEDQALTSDPATIAATQGAAQAVCVDQALLLDYAAQPVPTLTALAQSLRAAGFQVFSRTARAENAFLPPPLRRGEEPGGRGDVQKLIRALMSAPVDGLATDVPADAARVRRALAAR